MKYEIGEEVGVFLGIKIVYGYTVTKISPTGQVTVRVGTSNYRFDSYGNEIGMTSAFYGKARLVKLMGNRK